jgi:O-antigen/teichoic acid export membrane protein
VTAIVIVAGASVLGLAVGRVLAAVIGVGIYLVGLVTVLRRHGILTRKRLDSLEVPVRQVLGYSIPLMSSDLVFALRGSLVVIMLGIAATTIEVAAFRAVYPQARLVLIVLSSFTYLFTPAAARLFARGDLTELSSLQWHATAWVSLLSFLGFAASFVLADDVTVLLYGRAYASSSPILMLLSLGFMVSAVLGPAGLTLRAVGRVRYLVTVDVMTAIAGIAAYLVLIPAFGAIGAAVGTAGTLVAQGIAYQVGALRNGIAPPDRETARLGISLVVATVVLTAISEIVEPPLWLGAILVVVAWLVILRMHRKLLELQSIFPELGRIPLIRRIAGVNARSGPRLARTRQSIPRVRAPIGAIGRRLYSSRRDASPLS